MPRTHYRNGDSIGLESTGCDGCSPARINGVLCHETGCSEAWRDQARACFECGCDFFPESRWERTCPDCLNPPDEDEDEGFGQCEECGEELYETSDGVSIRCPNCDEPDPSSYDGGMFPDDDSEDSDDD